MASGYPSAIDTTSVFPADWRNDSDNGDGTQDGSDTIVGFTAQWMRDVGDALIKIQTELGINPSGTMPTVESRLNARKTVRKTADQTFTTTTLANVTDLTFNVAANTKYSYKFLVPHNAGTARGIKFAVDVVTATIVTISYAVDIYGVVADGASGAFHGAGILDADSVASSATVSATADNLAIIEGIIDVSGTGGSINLQAAQGGGATGANAIVLAGADGELYEG
jgi:hypothetical protein